MGRCAVLTCTNRTSNQKDRKFKMYLLPKDPVYAKQWIQACRREDDVNWSTARVCSMHFKPDDFELPLIQRLLNYTTKTTRGLKPDAIPSVDIPTEDDDHLPEPKTRKNKKKLKKNLGKNNKTAKIPAKLSVEEEIELRMKELCSSETESGDLEAEILSLNDDLQTARRRILQLETELKQAKEEISTLKQSLLTLKTPFKRRKSPQRGPSRKKNRMEEIQDNT